MKSNRGKMKPSRFNLIIDTGTGEKLAFNSSTCALAEVDDTFFEIYDNLGNLNFDCLSKEELEMVSLMEQGRYIVGDEVDEVARLEIFHNQGRYDRTSLGLTIAPTLGCNFVCPYCYETPDPKMMTKDTQDALVKMVKEQAVSIKKLGITWYGGEPLLAKEMIYDLSNRFLEICNEKNIDYGTYMITNGYLLDEETILKLKNECNVNGFQITLDGPPTIHDKRRIPASGAPTFYKILENVKLLAKYECKPSIRINVDKTNFNHVEELLDILLNEGLQSINVHLGQVTAYTNVGEDVENSCFTNEEFAMETLAFQQLLHEKGMKAEDYPFYPGIKANYCGADQVNAFVVDPYGYLSRCWNSVGVVEESVGNVNTLDQEIGYQVKNNTMWLTQGPFDNDECTSCSMLPICMGGCPYIKLIRDEKTNCEGWKYKIKDSLISTYLIKSGVREI